MSGGVSRIVKPELELAERKKFWSIQMSDALGGSRKNSLRKKD